MLQSLEDLKNFSDATAREFPSVVRRFLLKEPGISADDLLKLQDIFIPPVYKKCISAFDLLGRVIGYFAMSPGSIVRQSMAEALIDANCSDHPGVEVAIGAGLVVVAQEESNLICVGRSDSAVPDKVYLIEIMSSPVIEIQDVAADFERFMLLAGNVYEIGLKYDKNEKGAVAAMVECCRYFDCSVEQVKFWVSRAEIVAS